MTESKAKTDRPSAIEFEEVKVDLSLDPCIRGGRLADAYCHLLSEGSTEEVGLTGDILTILQGNDDEVILGVVSRLRHFVQYALPFEECAIRGKLRESFGQVLRGFLDVRRDEDVVYEAIESLGWLGDGEALGDLYRSLSEKEYRTYFGTATASSLARIFAFIRREYGYLDEEHNRQIDSVVDRILTTLDLPSESRLGYHLLALILSFSASVRGLEGLEEIARRDPNLNTSSREQWHHMVEIARAAKVSK